MNRKHPYWNFLNTANAKRFNKWPGGREEDGGSGD